MKHRLFILYFALSFLLGMNAANSSERIDDCGFSYPSAININDEIVNAFRTANATLLSKYLNATVDLSIPGHECTCSRQQVEQIMKTFFTKHPAKSFKINHQGASRDRSQYYIGTYVSDKGVSFRIYILMKKQDNAQLIQQIQVEEE